MKKLKFLAFALIAVLAVGFSSCSKDDDVTPPEQSEIEKVTGKRLTQVGRVKYEYDDLGRCVTVIVGDDGKYDIDWEKGEIVPVSFDPDEDEYDGSIHFRTTGKGYITEISTSGKYSGTHGKYEYSGKLQFEYDKSDHLTEINSDFSESGVEDGEKYSYKESDQYKIIWKDGNMVSAEYVNKYTEDGDTEKETYKYDISYSGYENNRFKQWCEGLIDVMFAYEGVEWLAHVGMFGAGTSNLPTSITTIFDYDYSKNTSISISTDSEGLIRSETVGSQPTCRYYYDEVGETRSASVSDNIIPVKFHGNPRYFFHQGRRNRK